MAIGAIPKNVNFLNESEVVSLFVESTGEDASSCYCKDCGKFLVHNEKFWRKNKTAAADMSEPLACSNFKQTFLQTKEYNGHAYRRCVCNDCLKKKFPEFKGKLTCQSAFYVQYAFGVSDEDFQTVKRNVCVRTKENFIKSYGEEEGTRRWNQYCQKQAETNTLEYKKEKYGWTEEQFKEFNKSRAVTLENLITRYGESLGKQKWHEYCAKQKYTCSLEYFIKKYGQEKGTEKYNDYMSILTNNYKNIGPVSEISQALCMDIHNHFPNNEIFYDDVNFEYKAGHYHLDYYDKTINVVIEFNGDYWHVNPEKYKPTDINTIRNMTAEEIWKLDAIRKNYIQTQLPGCIFITIWESDYRYAPESTVKTTVNEILKHIK